MSPEKIDAARVAQTLTLEQLDRLCEEALVIAQMDRDHTLMPADENDVKLSQAD